MPVLIEYFKSLNIPDITVVCRMAGVWSARGLSQEVNSAAGYYR